MTKPARVDLLPVELATNAERPSTLRVQDFKRCVLCPDYMVQRGSTASQDRGRKRRQSLSSRQAGDRTKRQRIEDPAGAATAHQAAEASGSGRRRSARETTRQQTAASDLTAAQQPVRARNSAGIAQAKEDKDNSSLADALVGRSSDVVPVPQQLERQHPSTRASSNTSADQAEGGRSAHYQINPQPSGGPASQHAGNVPSKRLSPRRRHRVSWDLPDAQQGTSSVPAASDPALQVTGRQRARVHRTAPSLSGQPDSGPPTDAANTPSSSAGVAEPAPPSTNQDNSIAAISGQQQPGDQSLDSGQQVIAKRAQHGDTHPDRQPSGSDPPTNTEDQYQVASEGGRQRTQGVLHPTFHGVKTSTAGGTHHASQEEVKQVWSAFLHLPGTSASCKPKLKFLGKSYWTPEAAARAVDRASIAVHGRNAVDTNFPINWYDSEVIMHAIQHQRTCLHPFIC